MDNKGIHELATFFNDKAIQYNHPSFIQDDPITIPHRFSTKQDIEIAGFFAALIAWGNRKSIINSCSKLMAMMGNSPYEFIMNLGENEAQKLGQMTSFVHRTFNGTDLLYLIQFLQYHYSFKKEISLESAFTKHFNPDAENIEDALNRFYQYVFSIVEEGEYPKRTQKHIAAPFKKSACKRLNMFLRWMVRKDNCGVDFGIWSQIKASQLICPIDIHVNRVAKRFQLLSRNQTDWLAAVELTSYLKKLDASDPVKYDFALFGLGVIEKF